MGRSRASKEQMGMKTGVVPKMKAYSCEPEKKKEIKETRKKGEKSR